MKLVLIFLAVACTCFPQTEPPKPAGADLIKYYHFDFAIKELEDGKVVNVRHYTMMAMTDSAGSIRTGDKVPVRTESDGKFTYIDVGVNIDCRNVRQVQDKLTLYVVADISSTAKEGPPSTPPLVRNTKWSSNVVLLLGKATVLFASDATTSKRQMELELTATPM